MSCRQGHQWWSGVSTSTTRQNTMAMPDGTTQKRPRRKGKPHLPDADTIVYVLLPAVDHAHKASLKRDYSVVQHVPGIRACARTKIVDRQSNPATENTTAWPRRMAETLISFLQGRPTERLVSSLPKPAICLSSGQCRCRARSATPRLTLQNGVRHVPHPANYI